MESATTSNFSGSENLQNTVLTEVPETLKKLTLYLAEIFYSLEHYVLVYYIQRNVIMKEEQIRDICKIDQRHLRQLMLTLKVY